MQEDKKGIKTMNLILLVLGITTVIFITVCFMFIWKDKLIPDALIYSYFTAISAEGFVMGWIKTIKEKKEKKDEC